MPRPTPQSPHRQPTPWTGEEFPDEAGRGESKPRPAPRPGLQGGYKKNQGEWLRNSKPQGTSSLGEPATQEAQPGGKGWRHGNPKEELRVPRKWDSLRLPGGGVPPSD